MIIIRDIAKWIGSDDKDFYNRVRLHVQVVTTVSSDGHEFSIFCTMAPTTQKQMITTGTGALSINRRTPDDMIFPLVEIANPVPSNRQLAVDDISYTSGTVEYLVEVIAELMPDNTVTPILP